VSVALILIGGASPLEPLSWLRLNADGELRDRGTGTPPATPPSATALIVPASDARLQRLALPARTEAQARTAAPLLSGVSFASRSSLHYAVGASQNEAGARLVAAIDAHRLSDWLQACRTVGAEPHRVMLDCTALGAPRDEVAVVCTPERVIVSAGALGGYSMEPQLASSLFAQWVGGLEGHIARIVVHGGEVATWRAAAGPHIEVVRGAQLDAQVELARGALFSEGTTPNLRQGEFATQTSAKVGFGPWRFAALLVVAMALLQVGARVFEGWRDRRTADSILAGAERDYRALRPDLDRVVNLRAQVRAATTRMRQAVGQPVLAVTALLSTALKEHTTVRLEELRHRAPDRAVTARVSAPEPAQLEALAAALRTAGARVEMRNMSPQLGRHTAELSVESGS
jgi:general secretion pathway protein L